MARRAWGPPCGWAAVRGPRVPGLVPGSSPGPRSAGHCWCPCWGVWVAVSYFGLVTCLCGSNVGVIPAAPIVRGFQAKPLENLPSQGLCERLARAELSAGPLATCYPPWAQAAPSAQRGSAAEGARRARASSRLRWEGSSSAGPRSALLYLPKKAGNVSKECSVPVLEARRKCSLCSSPFPTPLGSGSSVCSPGPNTPCPRQVPAPGLAPSRTFSAPSPKSGAFPASVSKPRPAL